VLHRNIFSGSGNSFKHFPQFCYDEAPGLAHDPHTQVGVKLGIEDAVDEALFEHG
jgi:hypothetical protein